MDEQDLQNRFNFHPATAANQRGPQHEQIRNQLLLTAQFINAMMPDCREKSLAVTHLEEVMFWANAGIARQP